MLRLEIIAEGFALCVGERRVLIHSRRAPSLEIGISAQRSSGAPARRRSLPLRSFKILESSESYVAFEFENRIVLAARFEGGRLRISFPRRDAAVEAFKLRLCAIPDEALFGCGERYGCLDLKGSRIHLRVEDEAPPGRGELLARALRRLRPDSRGGSSSRFPLPVFCSTGGYWCAVDTRGPAVFDFRRRASTLVEAKSVPREIVLGFGHIPGELLADMTAFQGRQAAPPEWAFDGGILGAEGGIAEFHRKLDAAIGAGARISAVWVRDWCGRRAPGPGSRGGRAWAWDRGLYPELPREIAALRSRGIRFLGYVSDLLALDGSSYAEASSRGWCVKGPDGKDCVLNPQSNPCAMLDLTHPEAFAWIRDVIAREMIGIGMSGWIADAGEKIPADAVLASGEDPAMEREAWPSLWARASREAIEAKGDSGELVFFVRSGWLGSSRLASAVWAGERASDFSSDGLASLVPAALSLGLSGVGFWHSEIGGSCDPLWKGRTGDCLGRWAESAAFSPFFRSGEGERPSLDAQPWSNPASLALFSRMSEVFASLKPYHAAVAADYAERGLPPMRHPWIHYPEDPAVLSLTRQYLYGRDLMVAPALSPACELTSLYLPAEQWVHLWSSRRFEGGRVSVDSPPGCPAVFYRASSPFASLFDALRRTARRLH